jgi:hypothetical protein
VIAFLADEDFNAHIVRGLLRRIPALDLLTVDHAGLAEQPDSVVISWAAVNGRVLLTHDLNTMIDAALDLVRSRQPMPGLIAVPQQVGIGAAIQDVALIAICAEANELEGQIVYVPL